MVFLSYLDITKIIVETIAIIKLYNLPYIIFWGWNYVNSFR